MRIILNWIHVQKRFGGTFCHESMEHYIKCIFSTLSYKCYCKTIWCYNWCFALKECYFSIIEYYVRSRKKLKLQIGVKIIMSFSMTFTSNTSATTFMQYQSILLTINKSHSRQFHWHVYPNIYVYPKIIMLFVWRWREISNWIYFFTLGYLFYQVLFEVLIFKFKKNSCVILLWFQKLFFIFIDSGFNLYRLKLLLYSKYFMEVW